MYEIIHKAILAGFSALLISYFSSPLVIKLAKKYKIVDDPKKNKSVKKIHTYTVPRGGGVAAFIAVVITSLVFIPIDKHLIFILIGASLITILGVLDDIYNLNPYLRLVAQFFIVSLPIISGIGISFISSPSGGLIDLSHPQFVFQFLGETRTIWLISDLFALFWIVFMMNILNIGAKGVDGQLSGVVGVSALIIAFVSLRYSADITQWPVIILSLITAGAYIGMLPWNIFPQKIMPSYSGSTLAGYLLALLSILSTAKVGTLTMVLAIPLVDSTYVIVRRILTGKVPVWGDAKHLHHRLLSAGLSKHQVALLYWTFSGVFGLMALKLNASQKLYTIVGVVFFVGGLILWLSKIQKRKIQ